MSDHYYSAQPTSEHHFNEFTLEVRGVTLRMTTDAGVFSKNHLDTGTKILVQALPLQEDFQTVLDLGCGYGPIGLTIAKLLPKTIVFMSDINERAVELAVQNAEVNKIENVTIKAGEGFKPFPGQKFDFIVTNPPIRAGKQVIYPLVEEAYQALNIGGWLAAVIMTKQGAKSLEKKLSEVFGNVTEWEKESGYRVVASQKIKLPLF
ncbi:MAG TPA: 16S rRNA methyltransferase [Firmicutes bacterium]|nr:16S rRNA methyltransferase [Bacillota bacterium]